MEKFTTEMKNGHLIVDINLAAYNLTSVHELLISEDQGAWASDADLQLVIRAHGEIEETPQAEGKSDDREL